MGVNAWIQSYSYPELTNEITTFWLLDLLNDVSHSVGQSSTVMSPRGGGLRTTRKFVAGGAGKLFGHSEHAELTAFDYHIKIPSGGFKPEPGQRAIRFVNKPGEPNRMRSRSYTRLKGRTLRREGWLNKAFKLHFVDFGVQSEVGGEYGTTITQLPEGEARLTMGGKRNLKVLAQRVGLAYAAKVAEDVARTLADHGFDVEVFGPAVVTFRR